MQSVNNSRTSSAYCGAPDSGRASSGHMWLRVCVLAILSSFSVWAQMPVANGSFLGIGLVDLDGDHARQLNLDPERGGAVVTRVQPNTPADKAGIHVGDVLLSYNGEAVLGGY